MRLKTSVERQVFWRQRVEFSAGCIMFSEGEWSVRVGGAYGGGGRSL